MDKRFDAVSRDLVARHPGDWLPLVGLDRNLPVRTADSNVSTVTAEADVVLLVDGPNPGVLHFEVQSAYDKTLPSRMFRYNALLAVKHDRPVCSAAVLLVRQADGPAFQGPFEESWPDDRSRLTFRFPVVRVWQLQADDLLAAPGTAPLAPLAAGVTERDLPELVRRVGESFDRAATPDANVLWVMTDILMGLRFDEALVRHLLEGVPGMENSVTYQAILRKGAQKGRVEEARRMIVKLGTAQFGPPTEDHRERLGTVDDLEGLENLACKVLTSAGWDDLLASLT
jgi:hypothetical protein